MSTSQQSSRPPSRNASSSQQSVPQTSISGPRPVSNRRNIYDRNLNRSRTAELSRASFSYLFNEMISYAQRRVTGIADLEKRYEWNLRNSSP